MIPNTQGFDLQEDDLSEKIVIFSKNRKIFGPIRNAVIWAKIRNDYGEIVIVGMSACRQAE